MGETGPMGEVQAILAQLKIGNVIGAAIADEHECIRSSSACELIHSRAIAQQVIPGSTIERLPRILCK